jgi:hypothetical protein
MSSTVDGCLDEAWCEEGQRDRHAKHVSLMLRISHFKAEWSRNLDNLTLGTAWPALTPAMLRRAMAGTDANC